MKKAIILTTATLVALTWASFAMQPGSGQWKGFGQMLTAEERAKLQSLSPEERQAYIQELKEKYGFTSGKQNSNHSHNPADLLAQIPASDLSDTEKTLLINQYGEEKLAHDLYVYAYEKYGLQVFKNIADSETQHQEALKALFDRYGLTPPSDYAIYNDVVDDLKAKIDESLESALNVGIQAEIDDIEAIRRDILATDNDDIKVILTRIGGASYNHLKGFANALKQNGYEIPSIVYEYLSEEELNSQWPLVYKLAERLEAEGVNLPEMATAEYIKNECMNQNTNQNQRKMMGRNLNMNRWYNTTRGNTVMNQKKQQVKALIMKKYQAKINALSEERIQQILDKIDDVKVKIESSTTLTDDKKQLYILVLDSLKEILQERLAELQGTTYETILNDLLE